MSTPFHSVLVSISVFIAETVWKSGTSELFTPKSMFQCVGLSLLLLHPDHHSVRASNIIFITRLIGSHPQNENLVQRFFARIFSNDILDLINLFDLHT